MGSELFGRDHELAQLRRWAESACAGQSQFVVLEGEAGIGKTALASALAAQAAQGGMMVRWGNGVESGGAPPFCLWTQILGAAPADQEDRFALFEAIRGQLAAQGRLLVIVDDLQWVDEPSLLALVHVVRSFQGQGICIVATLRSSAEPGPWQVHGGALLRLAGMERIELRGLEAQDSERCVRAAATAEVPEQLLRQAQSLTRGNPFFLRELARASVEGDSLCLPSTAVDAVTYRVRRLSATTQEMLRAAAILGEEFDLAVVARLVNRSVVATLPVVEEAVRAGLLVQGAGRQVRFAHGLVRTALERSLSVQQAAQFHARAALAIEDLYSDSLAPRYADLARHWAQASVLVGSDKAVEAARRAADHAMARLAFEEASRLLTLALSQPSDSLPSPMRTDLLLARAAADLAAGRFDAAMRGCREAVAAGRDQDDPMVAARAALTLEAIGQRSWDRDVHDWAAEALADERITDAALRARLLARRAEAAAYSGMWETVDADATAALATAEASGDRQAVIAALRARQLYCSGPDHQGELQDLAARMIDLGRETGAPSVEMWGRLWLIDALWARGTLAEVANETARLQWCADRVGGPLPRWHVLKSRAGLAQARGEFAEALRLGREAFDLMMSIGHPAGFGAYMALMGPIGHHLGHGPGAGQLPPEAGAEESEVRAELFAHLGPALALAETGQLSEAAVHYRRPGNPPTWRIPPYFKIAALSLAAHIACLLGELGDVRYLASLLASYEDGHAVSGAGAGSYFGPVALILGRCSAALGDTGRAKALFTKARDTCAQIGAPGFEVEAATELADLLRAEGAEAEARALASQYQPIAVRLGMTPWAARLSAYRPLASHALSARELEVAELVAAGCSNRDIAARLYISERTAQNHVQHVLGKLGFSRRSQIASWVTRMSTQVSITADGSGRPAS